MAFKVTSPPYLNTLASTVPKWQTFILLKWVQNLHLSALDFEGLSSVTMVTTPFLCDSVSRSKTHCLTTVTTVGYVTMEIKVSSLPQLNNPVDTVYLSNVRKVGEFVVSRNSCILLPWGETNPMSLWSSCGR
jgi:hypothetical protein